MRKVGEILERIGGEDNDSAVNELNAVFESCTNYKRNILSSSKDTIVQRSLQKNL